MHFVSLGSSAAGIGGRVARHGIAVRDAGTVDVDVSTVKAAEGSPESNIDRIMAGEIARFVTSAQNQDSALVVSNTGSMAGPIGPHPVNGCSQ